MQGLDYETAYEAVKPNTGMAPEEQTANSVCIWAAHQPEFPEGANKIKFNK